MQIANDTIPLINIANSAPLFAFLRKYMPILVISEIAAVAEITIIMCWVRLLVLTKNGSISVNVAVK